MELNPNRFYAFKINLDTNQTRRNFVSGLTVEQARAYPCGPQRDKQGAFIWSYTTFDSEDHARALLARDGGAVPAGPLTDAIAAHIAQAQFKGVVLSKADEAQIRDLMERAASLRGKADRTMEASGDPMRKGHAFPMGVGFTKMTKRAEQRIDASVRRAGEAVAVYKTADQCAQQAERMLSGKDTEADKQRKADGKLSMQQALVLKLLNWKKGDKIGAFTIERVSKNRDGYPASYTISGDGIIKGIWDKVDVVREFFGGDDKAFRSMVDAARAPNPKAEPSPENELALQAA